MTLHDQLSKMIADAEANMFPNSLERCTCHQCELCRQLVALAKWAQNLHATADAVDETYLGEWCEDDAVVAFRAALSAPLEVEQ